LHKGPFELQTMTVLIKSFYGGSRGAVFSKRAPLAAGGKLALYCQIFKSFICLVTVPAQSLLAAGLAGLG
jgi:hypothetical protein